MNEWFEAEQRVERAHDLYESGRWEDALRELRAALNVNPYQGEWHFNMGLTLDAMGRYEEAIVCFEKAMSLHGEEPDILTNLAINCLRADRPEQALDYLTRSLKHQPNDIELLAHLIEAHARLDDHENADVTFYLAVQIDDSHPRVYHNIADSLLERGDLARAIWCLNRVRRLDPHDPDVMAKLGDAHRLRGQLDRALYYFKRQLRLDPTDTEAMLDLGDLLLELGRPHEAAEQFRRVVDYEPAHAEAHYNLGLLNFAANELDAAQTSFELVLRLSPNRPRTHHQLARIALQRNRPVEARRHLRAELAIPHTLEDTDHADNLGHLLLDANMPREATAVYRELSRRHPDRALLMNHYAVSLFLDGRLEEGIRICRNAIRLNPDCIHAFQQIAYAHLQLGQTKRAKLWVKRGLELDPEDRRLRQISVQLLAVTIKSGLSNVMMSLV